MRLRLVVEVGVFREGIEGRGLGGYDVVVGLGPVELVSFAEFDVVPGPQEQEELPDVARIGAVVGLRERRRRLGDIDHVLLAEGGEAGGRLREKTADAVLRGRPDVLDQGVAGLGPERLVVTLFFFAQGPRGVAIAERDVEHAALLRTEQLRRRLLGAPIPRDLLVSGDPHDAQLVLDGDHLFVRDIRRPCVVLPGPRREGRQCEAA